MSFFSQKWNPARRGLWAGAACAGLLVVFPATAPGDIVVTPMALTNRTMAAFNAPGQTLVVSNSGPSPSAGVVISYNTNYVVSLSKTAFNAPRYVPVLINVTYVNADSALAPGTYVEDIIYTIDKALSITSTVTLNIMELAVAPAAVSQQTMEGYDLPAQSFDVWNPGGGEFEYTVTPQAGMSNWVTLSASNGVAGSNTVWLEYAPGLTPGLYSGIVTVATDAGGGATSEVPVSVGIVSQPILEVQPSVITQRVDKGRNPDNDSFTIRNASGAPAAPMGYTLTVSNEEQELIRTLDPAGGGINTGQVDTVQISYVDLTQATGSYHAIILVGARDVGTDYAPTGTVSLSASITVRVDIVTLDPPSGVQASDGTYDTQVLVSWNPVPGAALYRVYRSPTFDSSLAEPIGSTTGTTFADLMGVAGRVYYYWVSSVNAYQGEGLVSLAHETGYRALAAPQGIFATDGDFTNQVRVTWPMVDGATGYQIYRRAAGGAWAPIYFTSGSLYSDYNVAPGLHYEYRLAATNGVFGSGLSVADSGFAFGMPDGVAASDGAFVGCVRVSWRPVESALSYEIWRSTRITQPPSGGAIQVGRTSGLFYDDTTVSAGTIYYYWVRAESLTAGLGGWSLSDRGYSALAGVDLAALDFVVLPPQVGPLQSPSLASVRLENRGPGGLSGDNSWVAVRLYASTNAAWGMGGERLIGNFQQSVTLGAGAGTVLGISPGRMILPAEPGEYSLFVSVTPTYPSQLAELNPADNIARRTGTLRVSGDGRTAYRCFNDYDGDGRSDLGVYSGPVWRVRTLDGRVLASSALFQGSGRPVLGDYDGDRRADPIVYDRVSGLWQILFSGRNYAQGQGPFAAGTHGLIADFEGLGPGNPAVFDRDRGRWYILTSKGLFEWNWGEADFEPVIGDYDGDGKWDLAVYQESTGAWFVRTLDGRLLVSGAGWGGPGHRPVPGDFDGDGFWDAAIYCESAGTWSIVSPDGRIMALNMILGGPGRKPVMGDYDGDGKWDLAVYEEASGRWYIKSLDGRRLAWGTVWGGPGYAPLGQ